MNATEWLNELKRLRNAAIMPPYYLRKKRFFGEDEEGYYITDKGDRIICIMKALSTEPDNAAYIVAACNAVPRLIDMLRFAAGIIEAQATINNGGNPATDAMQALYNMTEQKQ